MRRKAYKYIITFAFLLCIAAQLVCLLPSARIGAETSDPRKAYEEKLKAAQDQKAELEKKKKEQEALIAEFTAEKENMTEQQLTVKMRQIIIRWILFLPSYMIFIQAMRNSFLKI